MFTAAQAAQKLSLLTGVSSSTFTAAQAAQKVHGVVVGMLQEFTAAQAAQKHLVKLGITLS